MKCPPFSSPGTRPSFLGRFTVQERFRLFSHGHGVSFTLDSKDPFHSKHGGSRCEGYTLHIHKNRAKTGGNSSWVYSRETKSSSSPAEECVDDDGGGADDYEEDYVDDGGVAVRDELACFRGLVLDISYRPINVVCWRRAICLEFMEKVDVLEYYDQTVNSPSGSFYIPAVMRVPNLLQVVKRRRIKHHLGRKNILYRDHFTCQYCSSRENLTIDHVLPISRGGEWKWENLVTACAKCNSRKGQKTLDEANMKLIKVPKPPKDYDILSIPLTSTAIKNLRMRKGLPDEWRQYLSKPSSEP